MRNRFIYLYPFFLTCLLIVRVAGQQAVSVQDTVARHGQPMLNDSIVKKPVSYNEQWVYNKFQPLMQQVLSHHPYFNYNNKPVIVPAEKKIFYGKEAYFYLLAGLFLLLALIKMGFPKYFNDLLRVFFRTTLKGGQLREQLVQNPAPSVLFNILFVLVMALYVVFTFYHFGQKPIAGFWVFYGVCCIIIAFIYVSKYLLLKLLGWLLSIKNVTESYIFIVFLINKVIGILLLPVLCFMAFSSGNVYETAILVSWLFVAGLFLYRLILGYGIVRRDIGFQFFHFALYMLAFEIAPLLVIYKLALLYS